MSGPTSSPKRWAVLRNETSSERAPIMNRDAGGRGRRKIAPASRADAQRTRFARRFLWGRHVGECEALRVCSMRCPIPADRIRFVERRLSAGGRFDGEDVVVVRKPFKTSCSERIRGCDVDEIGRLGWGDQAVVRSFGTKAESGEHFAGVRLRSELLCEFMMGYSDIRSSHALAIG